MQMEQSDCPFIDTSTRHDVSFSTFQWEFDESNHVLETRMVVEARDRDELNKGLQSLRDHEHMYDYGLLKRWEDIAHIRTTIAETDAMETIRSHDGYITGPFYIEQGAEIWHVGFDSQTMADTTLSDLDRNNEYVVLSREENSLPDLQELVQNANAGVELIKACKDLSDVEQATLVAAVEGGYFESPRQATLGTLAEEFDVSKPAVSKNLRRAQEKVSERVVSVLGHMEDEAEPMDGD